MSYMSKSVPKGGGEAMGTLNKDDQVGLSALLSLCVQLLC